MVRKDLSPFVDTDATVPIAARRVERGFNLIELLVVIAIIAILAALLLPALIRSKEQGRATVCKNNARQLSIGIQVYSDDFRSYYPWPGEVDRNKSEDWIFGGHRTTIPIPETELSKQGFALHAESGSVFSYVTGLPRVAPHSDAYTNSFSIFRCPSGGKLGEARRVTITMNAYFDIDPSLFPPREDTSAPNPAIGHFFNSGVGLPGVNSAAVLQPSRKILLVDESPETCDNASFKPGFGFDIPGGDFWYAKDGAFKMHNGRVQLNFVDGHVEAIKKDNFLKIMNDPVQKRRFFDPKFGD